MNTCFQDAACRHYHHFLIVVIIIIISCSLESRRKRHDRCWVCSVKAYRPMVRRSAEAHGGRGRADARLKRRWSAATTGRWGRLRGAGPTVARGTAVAASAADAESSGCSRKHHLRGVVLGTLKWLHFSRSLNVAANVDGCPVLAAKTVWDAAKGDKEAPVRVTNEGRAVSSERYATK